MTIFIGNLSWETEVEDLEQLFSNYGVVKKCYLPLDRETGRKRGFAFVDLNDYNSEKKAIDDLQSYLKECVEMEDVTAFNFEEIKDE